MAWTVIEHPDFSRERKVLAQDILQKLAEVIVSLERAGPQLCRPLVDTLKGSKHKNMKEIRLSLGGAWRFAFAFDPNRNAVILVYGNKEGVSSDRFYRGFVSKADKRFADWLETIEAGE